MKCLVAANILEFPLFRLLFFDVLLTSSREPLELQSRAALTLQMAFQELVQNANKAGQSQRNPAPPSCGLRRRRRCTAELGTVCKQGEGLWVTLYTEYCVFAFPSF